MFSSLFCGCKILQTKVTEDDPNLQILQILKLAKLAKK